MRKREEIFKKVKHVYGVSNHKGECVTAEVTKHKEITLDTIAEILLDIRDLLSANKPSE